MISLPTPSLDSGPGGEGGIGNIDDKGRDGSSRGKS